MGFHRVFYVQIVWFLWTYLWQLGNNCWWNNVLQYSVNWIIQFRTPTFRVLLYLKSPCLFEFLLLLSIYVFLFTMHHLLIDISRDKHTWSDSNRNLLNTLRYVLFMLRTLSKHLLYLRDCARSSVSLKVELLVFPVKLIIKYGPCGIKLQ